MDHGQQSGLYPVNQQPGTLGFSGGPGGSVAPGLEPFSHIDQLLVQQKVELLEVFTGYETNNRYTVLNSLGQEVYRVEENTECCVRLCCGQMRPFDVRVMDGSQREVLHLSRPLRCQGCCYPCCLQQLEVRAGDQVIGVVRQQWSLLRPHLTVHRPDGTHVLSISGPICPISLCGRNVNFTVLSADGTQEVGKITKQWSGLVKEVFTDADTFGISFPMDLETNVKAVLFGALFLVDFMFFEREKGPSA